MIQAHTGFAAQRVAVLWFHANTNRFYDLPSIHVGKALSALGYSFLTANTQLHEVDPPNPRALTSPFSGGPLDLDPWITYTLSKGYSGVVLIGHSFGANKVAYYQAHTQDPRVLGVVFASPDLKWQADPHTVALAETMLAQGKGDTLMPRLAGNPSWYRISAKTLVDRALISRGLFTVYNGNPLISRISCPVLAFYGTEESWCGGQTELRSLKKLAISSPRVDTHLLHCADHVYSGRATEVANLLANWINTLTPAEPASTRADAAYIA